MSNNQTIYGDFTSIVQNYGVGTFNPVYTYTPNTISVNGNNNTVYGNGGNVTFSATGSNNNTVDNAGISEIQTLTLAMGGNTLLASGNNNAVYGSIQDLSITLTGGNNNTSPDGAGYADLDQFSIQLGSNIIGSASAPISGNNDVVYGAMRNFTMNLIGGFDPNASSSPVNGSAFTGFLNTSVPSYLSVGDNTIMVGNGNNDVIYGAMQNLNINMTTPNNSNVFAVTNWNYTHLFTNNIGDNIIAVGSGNNDTVFGALQDFNLLVASGSDNNLGILGDSVIAYNFGSNTINVGNGNNDTVYGALQDITLNGSGPSGTVTGANAGGNQPYFWDRWNIGDNNIQVGNGNNDIVYGAMRDFTLNVFGGNDNYADPAAYYGGSFFVYNLVPSVGGNTLTVGNGNNDVVFGAMQDFALNFTSGNGNIGNTSGSAFEIVGTYSFGNNMMTVGNGNNDTVYGAMEDFTITIKGGNDNGISAAGTLGGGASIYSTSFSAGENHIMVGNGNNDVVYGDMNNLSILLYGGSSNAGGAAGGALYENSTISLGGDIIQVGNGNNDVVFASMNSLTLLAQDGINNEVNSGFASFSLPNIPGFNAPAGDNVISFNDTTVTIGNGNNDTVVADDALNLSGLSYFLDVATPPGQENQIQWGNNTIIGGTKADNYVFSMVVDPNNNMAMQGVDILTNFNPNKGDMLSFGYVTGAANAATLDANSAFVDIHVGGTLSGAIDGVAAIFNQDLGASVATALENAINSFIAANDPHATGLALLQDVAAYIANGLASAAGVTAADVQGGLILEGQTSATLGSFTQINAHHALTVEHTAVAVHA